MQHCGRSTASNLKVEWFLASLVFGFLDKVAGLVSAELAAYRARLTDVISSVSDSLQLDLQSIVELLRAAEQGFECIQLAHRYPKGLVTCFWGQIAD